MALITKTFVFQAVIFSLFAQLPFESIGAERWYSKAQAENGKRIFNTNCASCHGIEAVGTNEWRKPLSNGKYPAPPLNGTAHSWHHNLTSLRRQINQGGAKYGGWMPAMESSLTPDQVDEAISYIQSLWPEKIYNTWYQKNSGLANKDLTDAPALKDPNTEGILRHLISRLPNSTYGKPVETPLPGIYRVTMDDSVIYLSSDGRYVFLGDMVDLVSGQNFTRKAMP